MARTRKQQPVPPNGFVASATTLPTATRDEAGIAQGWQSQAWTFYDTVPELRYVANWIGNVMSRGVLHAAKREGNELIPQDTGNAREAMDALYGGPQGQAEMMKLLGVDTTVGGEGYVFYRASDDTWYVVSTGKVTQNKKSKQVTVNLGNGETRYEKQANDLLIRIWTPHATEPKQADAPTRSNLKTLAQIVGYDDHISAQLTSRLAGAGILPLPEEIKFAAPQGSDPEAPQADTFLATLKQAMEAAIQDRQSPAAFVPIVITVPGEYMDMLPEKPITFWSDLDENVIAMRDSAIKRFAIGMDVPPEVVTGNADANHWNAWLSEESAIKAHLEPRLSVINHGLTGHYLRPALIGMGMSAQEAESYFVIADTSEIRTRPNRATDARELRSMGLLNIEATLREGGFKPEDRMDEKEYALWLLERVATGAVTPELTAEALRILGANIDTTGIEGLPQDQPRSNLPPPTDDTEDRDIPDQPEPEPLVAACQVLAFRALERAGNRLKNQHPRTDVSSMPTHTIYQALAGDADYLLEGAWECAPEALSGLTTNVEGTVEMLDFYVRGLLSQKRATSVITLSRLLSTVPEIQALEA